ncbi:uncharacterized protein LOC110893406 [Helianthus annuus]|uniref:uncharacterized protein LOC110893406 n=1 Tax=Helianthus annuus TaxID=4232 RepID=UPI000B901F04|nr:uncharacterized protein LOC110893406 [Helianthus annuus]
MLSENKVSVCAILETHVEVANLDRVCKNVFRGWSWTSNGGVCQRGTRIILGWDSDVVDVMILSQTDQVIHSQIWSKADNSSIFCSFVYAKNKYQERRSLWEDLCRHKLLCLDKAWFVMGDFNSALSADDSLFGPSSLSIGMREFCDCIEEAELIDVKGHGIHFTWNQKPKEGVGLMRKIDRVMSNVKCLDLFPDAYVIYHPYRVSDHTPCILKLSNESNNSRPKPFKFANFIVSKPEFKVCVEKQWAKKIDGFAMFSVVSKLRNLKPDLRKILFQQGNLHKRVLELCLKLDEIQEKVDANPMDVNIRKLELECLKDFKIAAYDEECFLKQKSKVEWLCAGDSNTAFFHNTVKCRNNRTKIQCITDVSGRRFEGDEAVTALVDHYSAFLGKEDPVTNVNMDDVFVNVLNSVDAANMV